MVTIVNGVNTLEAELDGNTVAEVRTKVAQALNIDPAAVSHVNGEVVNASYVLDAGDELEFIKASGQKG